MTCKWCGRKTDWDSSVGRPCYLVCNCCVREAAKEMDTEDYKVVTAILKVGWRMERQLSE